MGRTLSIGVLVALLAATSPISSAAQPSNPGPTLPELRSQASRSRAEQLQATRDYKASLERLLVLREHDVQRALEQLERTRALVDRGIVARKDLEAAERTVADARARLDQTWTEAIVAASVIAKVLAYEDPAASRPLAPGHETATAALIRYQGRKPWALTLVPTLESFFRRAFNRALPVSAYGQTAIHDKLGFDHRHAIDVAVHPDSAEGRALMDWLRKSNLSFIAFRGAVEGAATGAHIHVGEPSQRLASP